MACKTRQYGQTFTPPYFYSLAKHLGFDKVKETLGLDQYVNMIIMITRRTRLCIASAAPITDETVNFFASYDWPIYDLLGQSEGTAPICMNSFVGQLWKVWIFLHTERDHENRWELLERPCVELR